MKVLIDQTQKKEGPPGRGPIYLKATVDLEDLLTECIRYLFGEGYGFEIQGENIRVFGDTEFLVAKAELPDLNISGSQEELMAKVHKILQASLNTLFARACSNLPATE